MVVKSAVPLLSCSPAGGNSVSSCVSLPGWRVRWAAFTCIPLSVAGWVVKGILGMTPYGGEWVFWTGCLKPTQCGCCWQSARRRPAKYCSNSRRGWGGTVVSHKYSHEHYFRLCNFILFFTYIIYSCSVQVFLVRKSAALQRKVLSVRVAGDQLRTTISHFPVRETKYSK